MCRSIKTLYNFAPPASEDEVRAAALQFVRKISGLRAPSAANTEPFAAAVDEIAAAAAHLLRRLETKAPPKSREAERGKARVRSMRRYG